MVAASCKRQTGNLWLYTYHKESRVMKNHAVSMLG